MPSESDNPPAVSSLASLSGTVLEQRYELGRVLGEGGMGAVFEARHLRLDRPVAIKVLQPIFAAEREYIERFLREAKAASKIRHRNVVELLDYGETTGGTVYSVMEFLVGQDLAQLLRTRPERRIPWTDACGLLVQIASGLKAAHGHGVIHRDIKPANCFLTYEDDEPVVKLVDFGIAKLEGTGQGASLTGTAQVLGTPSYIAPELLRSESRATPRSDIYSLGVLAYKLLTGRLPFVADTVFDLLRRVCFEPAPPMAIPDLPPAVESFVMELLSKEPERRPPDMHTVRQRLVSLGERTIGVSAVRLATSSPLHIDNADSSRASTPPAAQAPQGDMVSVTADTDAVATVPFRPGVDARPGPALQQQQQQQQVAPVDRRHATSPDPEQPGRTVPYVEPLPHLAPKGPTDLRDPRATTAVYWVLACGLSLVGVVAVVLLRC